jgi:hypothetical protein
MSAPPTSFTTVNKVGLVLAGLLGLADMASVLQPTPEGETGPPFGILVLGSLLGLVTVVAVVWAFRSLSRGAVRIVAAARIVSAITALPAFFVDIPDALRLFAGAMLVVTVVVVVMILTPARRSELVLD